VAGATRDESGSGSGTAGRSRWLALGVLCTATLMIILDGTIVTVALPSIQHDLGFSATGLEWVMNGYLIAFGGLLLLSGRLGDLLGAKRVFIAGILLFSAASLACGLAVSQPMLIAARFAQGAGGAMASAVSLGMIVRLFPAPRERAKAMGGYSFTGAGGASLGFVLGGVLTQTLSWHWIFFVNVPIGAAVAAAGAVVLDDMPGVGLRAPLLPLRLFRSREVSAANAVQALTVAAAFGFQVLISQYLQRVLGYSPEQAGLALLPTAVMIGTLSVGASARLNARFGPRVMLIAGLLPIAAGLALLLRLPVAGGYAAYLLPTMVLIGGFGVAFPAMITLAMSAASSSDAGVISGLVNTVQQVSAALGVAVLGTLAAAHTAHLAAGGMAVAAALTGGYRLAFGTGAGLVLAAAGVAAVAFRPAAGHPASSASSASSASGGKAGAPGSPVPRGERAEHGTRGNRGSG
jgi:predicted MFS family arabinose efflux permease